MLFCLIVIQGEFHFDNFVTERKNKKKKNKNLAYLSFRLLSTDLFLNLVFTYSHHQGFAVWYQFDWPWPFTQVVPILLPKLLHSVPQRSQSIRMKFDGLVRHVQLINLIVTLSQIINSWICMNWSFQFGRLYTHNLNLHCDSNWMTTAVKNHQFGVRKPEFLC